LNGIYSINRHRNLFAIDYLKEHPSTSCVEFAAIFEGLDKETRKVSLFYSKRASLSINLFAEIRGEKLCSQASDSVVPPPISQ
jgi:hypothetical protein